MLDEHDKKDADRKPTGKWVTTYAFAMETTFPIVGGAVGGLWVDAKYDCSPWGFVVLTVVGFGVSVFNLIRLSKKLKPGS